jgi:hypothetical protein
MDKENFTYSLLLRLVVCKIRRVCNVFVIVSLTRKNGGFCSREISLAELNSSGLNSAGFNSVFNDEFNIPR